MAFKAIKVYLPEFFHPFLPEIFSREIPSEIFTNCTECPMICGSRKELGFDESKPFAPDTKCCTYFPHLPNFLVGAVFFDTDTSLEVGRNKLRDHIMSRKGIFPHGIYPTKKYSALYELGKAEGFGKSQMLKCPFYLEGMYNCGLWKYREAVCSTWFCKHVGQQSGHLFWSSVTKCLRYIEESLIAYVLKNENLPFIHPYGENKNISYEDLDDLQLNKDEYNFRWGKWAGKEEEFYIRAYQYVKDLTPEKISSLMGINFQVLLAELEERYNVMLEIPEHMIADPAREFSEIKKGYYRILLKTWIERNDSYVTYAIDIPSIVIDKFDGTLTTLEVLITLKEKYDIDLGRDILIALYQHGILIKS